MRYRKEGTAKRMGGKSNIRFYHYEMKELQTMACSFQSYGANHKHSSFGGQAVGSIAYSRLID